ncbi:MAG: multicopper oxidase domain-containing protein [Candidatus Binataceae bacterium]
MSPALARAALKQFTLTVENKTIEIGDGMTYGAWTYDGAAPGPVLRVRQGDTVRIHLINKTSIAHGIDTHAAQIAPSHFDQPDDKKEFTYTFRAETPGVFMYHCSASPMLVHIANGMYGMMIVEPAGGWPDGKAHEVTLIQSEYYGVPDAKGFIAGDSVKMMKATPDFVVFNGQLERYVEHPIQIKVGELVRVFFVDAGPNLTSTFHVIGAIFSTVYRGGNPANPLHGLATFEIGPGDGAMLEFRVTQPGDYMFIDHAMARAYAGAMGIFRAVK